MTAPGVTLADVLAFAAAQAQRAAVEEQDETITVDSSDIITVRPSL